MSLKVCPQPGPRAAGPDCPLYARRLLEAQREARLSAAIRREQGEVPSLGSLVWADFNRQYKRSEADVPSPAPTSSPTRPVLPPAPQPAPLPIFDQLKEESR
jgi:hypothetical protein